MKEQKLKGGGLCGRYGPLNRLLLAVLLCAFHLNAGSATLPLTPQEPDRSGQQPPCYHKGLDDWAFLEGDWTVRINARLSASGPWEETEASAQIKRELSGCLLAERFTGTRRGQPLHAYSLFAWNDNSKKLQQVFSDSGHGPLIFYEGAKAGQEILLDVDWKLPDGRSVRLRRAYFNLKPDSFTVESRRSPDGGKTWDTTGRMDYRRKAKQGAVTNEAPPRVDRPALVFDAKRRKVVLFGGGFGKRMQGETWEYDGQSWVNRRIPGPPKRNSHCMVYDSRRGKVVLFGGYADGLLGDTWEYDGQTWRQTSTTGPAPRGAFGMAYDSKRGKTVLFGGAQDAGQPSFKDTWEWDGVKWTQVITTAHPLGNYFHRMAFDEKRGQVISFGGRWGSSETWAFDGRDWQRLSEVGPPGRDHHAMTFDSARGKVVIFGGVRNLPGGGYAKGEPPLRDLWEWDGAKWELLDSDGPANYGGLPGFAYDSAHKQLVLFGKSSDPALKEEVAGHWRWDGRSWVSVK